MPVFIQHDLHEVRSERRWRCCRIAPCPVPYHRQGSSGAGQITALKLSFGKTQVYFAQTQQGDILVAKNMCISLPVNLTGCVTANIRIAPLLHSIVSRSWLTRLIARPEIAYFSAGVYYLPVSSRKMGCRKGCFSVKPCYHLCISLDASDRNNAGAGDCIAGTYYCCGLTGSPGSKEVYNSLLA